jgi:DNA invertase Pin-like site-specific DNA recombinase/DNA-binding CsgD family transcriptional regulator
MVAAIRAGDTVIAAKADRFSRHSRSGIAQAEDWLRQGVHMMLLDLPMRPGDAWDAAAEYCLHMFLATAQLEHGRIRERTMAGKAEKRARGQYPDSIAPYGWMIERRGPDGRERYKVENPQEQKTLRRAYALWDEQLPVAEILHVLAREGHRNRKGGLISAQTLWRWCVTPERANLSARSQLTLARRKILSGTRRDRTRFAQIAPLGPATAVKKAAERAERVLPFIRHLISCGCNSYSKIADQLNLHDVPAFRGGRWYPSTVRNLMLAAGLSIGKVAAEVASQAEFANVVSFPTLGRPGRAEREAARIKYRLDEALPPKRRGKVQKLLPDILALFDRGIAMDKIARLLGIHINSVEMTLRKFTRGTPPPPRPATAAMAAATLPLSAAADRVGLAEEIITRRLTGATGQQIARDLDIVPEKVYETLRRAKRERPAALRLRISLRCSRVNDRRFRQGGSLAGRLRLSVRSRRALQKRSGSFTGAAGRSPLPTSNAGRSSLSAAVSNRAGSPQSLAT